MGQLSKQRAKSHRSTSRPAGSANPPLPAPASCAFSREMLCVDSCAAPRGIQRAAGAAQSRGSLLPQDSPECLPHTPFSHFAPVARVSQYESAYREHPPSFSANRFQVLFSVGDKDEKLYIVMEGETNDRTTPCRTDTTPFFSNTSIPFTNANAPFSHANTPSF